MSDEITLRDTFAASALTGLLAQGDDGSFSEESYARAAYRWADVMLRERGVTEPLPKEKRAEVSDTLCPQVSEYTEGISARAESKPALTDEEREAIYQAAIRVEALCQLGSQRTAATLRNLLERLA